MLRTGIGGVLWVVVTLTAWPCSLALAEETGSAKRLPCYDVFKDWEACFKKKDRAACKSKDDVLQACRKEARFVTAVEKAKSQVKDNADCSKRDDIKLSKKCSGYAVMKVRQAINALHFEYGDKNVSAANEDRRTSEEDKKKVRFVNERVLPRTQDYRVCFVGDTGDGKPGQEAVAAMLKEKCDEIRHLGDIIYYTGIEDEEDGKLLDKYFFNHYKDLGMPMYLVLGNHDYYANPDIWLKVPELAKKRQSTTKFEFPNFYYLDVLTEAKGQPGLCLLSLDTTPFATPNTEEPAKKCALNDAFREDKKDAEAARKAKMTAEDKAEQKKKKDWEKGQKAEYYKKLKELGPCLSS